MGDQRNGGITWTEETWNPIRGCSKVSAGCANCYAETMAARFSGEGQPYAGLIEEGCWNGKARLVREHLEDPLRWRRPRRVFVNSMSDLFHESLSFDEIASIFGVMAAAPQHTFQVLTKRAARMREWFEWIKAKGDAANPFEKRRVGERMAVLMAQFDMVNVEQRFGPWPLPNVWMGVTVEDQAAADLRIPDLLHVPAAVRFVSCEPLLGAVNLREVAPWDDFFTDCLDTPDPTRKVHWVIAGGESGPHARPMHSDWPRGLRDQCAATGTPFLFKQWGEWTHHPSGLSFPGCDLRVFPSLGTFHRAGKKAAGRLLDGQLHNAYPAA